MGGRRKAEPVPSGGLLASRPGRPRRRRAFERPNTDSYLIPGTRIAAGAYPGTHPSSPAEERDAKLHAFLDAGITAFVDLTDPADGLTDYAPRIRELAAERGIRIAYDRLTIRDIDICTPAHMRKVLDLVDTRLAEGHGVYIHCWGGIGRTGLTVGCWLVRHGASGDQALRKVGKLFQSMDASRVERHRATGSPQTLAQRDMVREWEGVERPARPVAEPPASGPRSRAAGGARGKRSVEALPAPTLHDRYLGAMLGLAAGDALGTTVEFKPPGTFAPVTGLAGGGIFGLKPGQWTDDTSMALCLAESLLECEGFDGRDQLRRYVRWWKAGHWSSTGSCFDIGNIIRAALEQFVRTGEPFCGPTAANTAGNGSLMRLAPVPLYFARDPGLAIRMSADSSRTTHGTAAAVDACRYFAGLLLGALNGAEKDALLAPNFSPVAGLWEREPLQRDVAEVAAGSFRAKEPPAIAGTGYVVRSLEAALWAFATTNDFRSGALAAVNLGDDADTTGAIFGQIAGACYGVQAIPEEWRSKLTMGDRITAMAERLLAAAHP